MQTTARVAELDGMRGIAILVVMAFHYFARWPGLYPFSDAFVGILILADGIVGVFLFFIISGFVIFQSLERSKSILDFALRRADRLLLPMLVVSSVTLILLSGPLATPGFEERIANLLPSWTFTTPGLWRWVDPDVGYVDGVYWTLFIEVRFYVLMAILWFALRGRQAPLAISLVALGALALYAVAGAAGIGSVVKLLDLVLFPQYICLFACGVLYSEMLKQKGNRLTVALLCVLMPASIAGLIYAVEDGSRYLIVAACCAVFHGLFLSLIYFRGAVRWLTWRPLVFIGGVSYSLYLMHQYLGVALISRIPASLPLPIQIAGVVAVAALAIGVAALSKHYLEERRPFSRLRTRVVA